MLAVLAESALRSLILGSAVWVGLQLFRVRDPHIHMTSWAVVLIASLAMPLLMHWTTITIQVAPSALPAPAVLLQSAFALPDTSASPSVPFAPGMDGVAAVATPQAFNWSALALAVYATGVGVLLLRLAIGLCLTWRLVHASRPLNAAWAAGADVRVSQRVGGPVTFGSTIVLPPDHGDWDASKRQAVLAHEAAHVTNRDFYLLLLASLNRAIFWFSPFAWWQLVRLAQLAETISDARALEVVDDRLSYAEILLDLVQHGRPTLAGLHMARACTVGSRVERILSGSTVPVTGSWRKRLWTVAATAPVVVVSALTIGYSTPSRSTSASDTAAAEIATTTRLIDFYSFGPGSILAVFHDGDDLWGQLTWQRKVRLPVASDGTVSYPAAAGPISWAVGDDRHPAELILNQRGRESRATRIATSTLPTHAADAGSSDAFVGWYELTPTRALAVTREGDRIDVQETGRSKAAFAFDGSDRLLGDKGNLVVFLRDDQGKVAQALHYDPMYGARLASRIDDARAKAIEDDAARRLAQAPDRFRSQTPLPGSKDAILRGIADMQNGTPNYDRMSPALAAKARRQIAQLHPMMKAFGAVESIFFRGVGPGGYDIYGVKFANGLAEVRLLLGADGRADDVIFRPDGNDTPGGVVACSNERSLKSPQNTAPISVLFYNSSGRDMHLYELNSDGQRIARGTVGDDMSSSVWTAVETPWVVTDAAGTCLEVVLPGQRTRVHTIEAASSERAASPRTVPLAGSEAILRQYIEALGRGEPDYDRMTSEVAVQTRQQLTLNQAILNRLGPLQAMSFRGVSGLGSDIYMVHFANGTAEWRIGLVKDRTIGRIALGPQY